MTLNKLRRKIKIHGNNSFVTDTNITLQYLTYMQLKYNQNDFIDL